MEQEKKIFAIPHEIYNNCGTGTNNLIKEGIAKLVTTADDILEELEDKEKDKENINIRKAKKTNINPKKHNKTIIKGELEFGIK